jgi:hypothetical protein
MKGIGFDRVDLARRPVARDHDSGEPQGEPAERGDQDREGRIERRSRRQPLARLEPEQDDVEQVDERRHAGHGQPAERADEDREQYQAGFAGAHEGAQAARHVEGGKIDRWNPPAEIGAGRSIVELARPRHRVRRQW